MVVWFSVTVLAITLGFGLSGIYGVVACSNEELKLEGSMPNMYKLTVCLVKSMPCLYFRGSTCWSFF
jgi:hypothetical protein